MANFEIAHEKFLTTQGKSINNQSDKLEYVLCSECFNDEGLKITSAYIGNFNNKKCKNCKSKKGYKLNKNQIENIVYYFFVRGSFKRCDFGGFPIIQFNDYHYKKTSVSFEEWIVNDIRLIEETCKIGFFNYGPRFWMFGEIDPLKSLQRKGIERDEIIKDIINKYPTKYLDENMKFYRIRLFPQNPNNFKEYDSPPSVFLGSNRFDTKKFPVFYGSPDLELCIHECRTTVNDEIYCATIKPVTALKMLDLTSVIYEDDGVTEFESLEMAVHFLFLAGNNSYEICRRISKAVKKAGFDGIIFPSYFSSVKTGTFPIETIFGMSLRKITEFKDYLESQVVPNIAIFGRPIKQKKVKVECINSIQISKIEYKLNFGTLVQTDFREEEYINKKTNEFISELRKQLMEKKPTHND